MHVVGVLALPCLEKFQGADTSGAVPFLRGRAAGRRYAGAEKYLGILYLSTSAGRT